MADKMQVLDLQGLEELAKHIPILVEGDNITLTPDATKPNKITISSNGTGDGGKIESIKVNGVNQTISADKSVDITVPTITDTYSSSSENGMSGKAVASAISGKADSSTTLAGYGITDANISSGVITLGSNTITPLTSSSTLDATKVSGTLPSDTYTDTTYETFKKSGANAAGGLVPSPSTTAGTQKYLCEDGTWQIPDAARFAKSTGIGYFSKDDTSCRVEVIIPENNYVLQMYATNKNMHVSSVTSDSTSITVTFNKQSLAGALYVVTTEAEYPSNIATVITGQETYNIGDSTCVIDLTLPSGSFAINAYSTSLDTFIESYVHSADTNKLTVTFSEPATVAGSLYVMARKVE